MRNLRLLAVTGVAALLTGSAGTSLGSVTGYVWQNQPDSIVGNATLAQVAALGGVGTADATFNPAAIDYDSRVTGYTTATFLNNPTFFNTSAGFDPNGTVNNNYLYFTGTLFLQAGDNNFVVPHDDGLQLNIDGIGLVVDQPGPTAPVDTPFTVVAPADGTYNFELSYGEGFGPPAVLGFMVHDQPIGNVPEPASIAAWSLLTVLGLVAGYRNCCLA